MTTPSSKIQNITNLPLNGRNVSKEGKEMILTMKEAAPVQEIKWKLRSATLKDVEAAHELFDICSHHMIGKSEVSLSHVRSEWTSPGFDLENSVRVVDGPDGGIIGYVELWDIDDPPVSIWVWGRVHPDYEGQGIGTSLMNWAEERAISAISRVPDGLRVAMRSGTFSGYEPASDLFLDRNMSLDRHFLNMVIDLDEEPEAPLWPDGIQLRAMKDESELEAIVKAVRDAFQDHWGYVETEFETEYEQWLHFIRDDEDFDPSLWFLAMDGERIAGISLCREKYDEDPNMGWVSTLGVLRPWRRQGLGLALLRHSFRILRERGQKRAGLGVDAGSLTGATGLYEKAGMRCFRQFDTYELELRPGRDIAKRSL